MPVYNAQLEAWKRKYELSGFMVDSPEAEARAAITLSGLGHAGFLNDIRLLAKNARLSETPLVFIDRGRNRNAAAIDLNGKNVLTFHERFLRRHTAQEINGIIAHELAHIALGHTAVAVKPPSVLEGLMAWLPPPLQQARDERRHEFEADRLGAVIAGGVDGMISALKKVPQPDKAAAGWLAKVFNTHPASAQRIENLRLFAVTHAKEIKAGKENMERLRGQRNGAGGAPTP